jgi:hypothetical protein
MIGWAIKQSACNLSYPIICFQGLKADMHPQDNYPFFYVVRPRLGLYQKPKTPSTITKTDRLLSRPPRHEHILTTQGMYVVCST